MLLTRTVTKKVLETIVHETFSKFGKLSSSSLLDSLKLLGFYFLTTRIKPSCTADATKIPSSV